MKGYRQLTQDDRRKLGYWRKQGVSYAEIARRLGVHRSTVGREIRRYCGYGKNYMCCLAHGRSQARRYSANIQRRKITKDTKDREWILVEALRKKYSPEQAAAVFTKETGISLSTVSVYRWIYSYYRGGQYRGLRDNLRRSGGDPRHQSPEERREIICAVKDKTGSSIRRICDVLNVPRSGFYHAANETPRQVSDGKLGDLIEDAFHTHRGRYGYRRIARALAARGEVCAPARVRRIMRERNLKALQPKSFRPMTSDGRADAPSPNLIAKDGLPEAPNRVWAGDITYIRTEHGWLYLAEVIDLYTRKLVGWALAKNMRATLVVGALNKALDSYPKVEGKSFTATVEASMQATSSAPCSRLRPCARVCRQEPIPTTMPGPNP